MDRNKIAVLDFNGTGGAVVRRIRAMKVYAEVFPCKGTVLPAGVEDAAGAVLAGRGARTPEEALPGLSVPVLPDPGYGEEGDRALRYFLFGMCGLSPDWNMRSFVEEKTEEIRRRMGDGSALCAVSGGVDSAVCAALVHRAAGRRLHCVFVDTGLMRAGEPENVRQTMENLGLNLTMIDAEDRFLARLAGETDPERKRKIIGEEFIRVFEEEARKIGAVDFLVQGTIYPDVAESGVGNARFVKSHHNVGGLPSVVDFREIIEPLRELYKDEVREAGLALGLPRGTVMRQPFPGPGLAIRIIGEVTKEKLDILRAADRIFREEIASAGLDTEIWQYFVVLLDARPSAGAGVSAHGRYVAALRAVDSVDAVTAEWHRIPPEVLARASGRITAETPVGRVVLDITSKPPATIEWE